MDVLVHLLINKDLKDVVYPLKCQNKGDTLQVGKIKEERGKDRLMTEAHRQVNKDLQVVLVLQLHEVNECSQLKDRTGSQSRCHVLLWLTLDIQININQMIVLFHLINMFHLDLHNPLLLKEIGHL